MLARGGWGSVALSWAAAALLVARLPCARLAAIEDAASVGCNQEDWRYCFTSKEPLQALPPSEDADSEPDLGISSSMLHSLLRITIPPGTVIAFEDLIGARFELHTFKPRTARSVLAVGRQVLVLPSGAPIQVRQEALATTLAGFMRYSMVCLGRLSKHSAMPSTEPQPDYAESNPTRCLKFSYNYAWARLNIAYTRAAFWSDWRHMCGLERRIEPHLRELADGGKFNALLSLAESASFETVTQRAVWRLFMWRLLSPLRGADGPSLWLSVDEVQLVSVYELREKRKSERPSLLAPLFSDKDYLAALTLDDVSRLFREVDWIDVRFLAVVFENTAHLQTCESIPLCMTVGFAAAFGEDEVAWGVEYFEAVLAREAELQCTYSTFPKSRPPWLEEVWEDISGSAFEVDLGKQPEPSGSFVAYFRLLCKYHGKSLHRELGQRTASQAPMFVQWVSNFLGLMRILHEEGSIPVEVTEENLVEIKGDFMAYTELIFSLNFFLDIAGVVDRDHDGMTADDLATEGRTSILLYVAKVIDAVFAIDDLAGVPGAASPLPRAVHCLARLARHSQYYVAKLWLAYAKRAYAGFSVAAIVADYGALGVFGYFLDFRVLALFLREAPALADLPVPPRPGEMMGSLAGVFDAALLASRLVPMPVTRPIRPPLEVADEVVAEERVMEAGHSSWGAPFCHRGHAAQCSTVGAERQPAVGEEALHFILPKEVHTMVLCEVNTLLRCLAYHHLGVPFSASFFGGGRLEEDRVEDHQVRELAFFINFWLDPSAGLEGLPGSGDGWPDAVEEAPWRRRLRYRHVIISVEEDFGAEASAQENAEASAYENAEENAEEERPQRRKRKAADLHNAAADAGKVRRSGRAWKPSKKILDEWD